MAILRLSILFAFYNLVEVRLNWTGVLNEIQRIEDLRLHVGVVTKTANRYFSSLDQSNPKMQNLLVKPCWTGLVTAWVTIRGKKKNPCSTPWGVRLAFVSSTTPPTTTIIECGLTFIRFQPGYSGDWQPLPSIGVYVEV